MINFIERPDIFALGGAMETITALPGVFRFYMLLRLRRNILGLKMAQRVQVEATVERLLSQF